MTSDEDPNFVFSQYFIGIGIGIGVCRAQSLPIFMYWEGAFLGCFRPERLLVRLLLPRALPGCPAIIVS